MERLEHLTLEELREQLKQTDEKVPAQRLLTAIGRKQGDTIATLAERHNVTTKTIQNWLDRFEEKPLSEAPYNEDRSGRPPKLTDEEKDQFFADLQQSPEVFGYDREEWTPILAYHHLRDKFDAEYSLRHIRRMMNRASIGEDQATQLQDQS